MACDPNALIAEARCYLCLTEEQRATIILSLWCQILAGGSVGPGPDPGPEPGDSNYRITQTEDVRITQSGDMRVLQ